MTVVGVYVRISDDQAGESLGVQRQEADCRRLAEARGWAVHRVYTDNDVSAYKRTVRRPAFERLLVDLERGVLGGCVVYDLDRFARQPRDLERAIDLYEGRRPLVFATAQGDLDLSKSDGRLMARVMVGFANKSSADTARRVARKHLELAERGVVVGPRPYGWAEDKITLDPVEARQIEDGAARLLAGVSLGSLTNEWNAAGLRTTRGNPWSRQGMRQMFMAPRLAGYRVHRGALLRDESGTPVQGRQQAVLDPATWDALQVRLAPPATPGERPGGYRYLLSGLVRCGGCGHRMRGNARVGNPVYFCPPSNQGGCGGASAVAHRVDDIISELVVAHLRRNPITAEAVFDGAAELAGKVERIAALMAAYGDGTLDATTVFPTVKRLEAEVSILREAERAVQVAAHRDAPTAEAWPTLSLADRRADVANYLQAVVIKPAAVKGGRFDPARVEPVWR